MPNGRNPRPSPGVPKVDAWQQDQTHRTRRTPNSRAPVHVGPSLLEHLDQVKEGRRGRDQAIAHVDAGADRRWKAYAETILQEIIAEGRPFTSEDLRERTGEPLATGPTVFGSLLRAAMLREEIEHVGWDTSRRPQAHARPVRVWKQVVR